jgi:hypothetical protein
MDTFQAGEFFRGERLRLFLTGFQDLGAGKFSPGIACVPHPAGRGFLRKIRQLISK